ncbi:Hypothetical predicted protein [Paramuricea clavata]|uniref:Uncharacterized protein n=1 Tax=Paramuricea clavata TaxID=317549 RepID=A0A7D9I1N3_PARCT|nr:Hypothetical predicted protein [Paramuricea clavata]
MSTLRIRITVQNCVPVATSYEIAGNNDDENTNDVYYNLACKRSDFGSFDQCSVWCAQKLNFTGMANNETKNVVGWWTTGTITNYKGNVIAMDNTAIQGITWYDHLLIQLYGNGTDNTNNLNATRQKLPQYLLVNDLAQLKENTWAVEKKTQRGGNFKGAKHQRGKTQKVGGAGLAIPTILGAATKILPDIFGKKAKSQVTNNYGGGGGQQRAPPPPPPQYYYRSPPPRYYQPQQSYRPQQQRRQYYPQPTQTKQRGGRVFPKRRTKKCLTEQTHEMKCTHDAVDDEPVEVHDSGFMSPMAIFPTFPHNDTFVDSLKMKLIAGPIANPDAEEYTFIHAPNDYGVMDLQYAKIKATIALTDAANANLG